MPAANAILVGNLAVVGYLTGLIWYVQIVHYPLFAQLGAERFARYHARHSALTTRVVALPMLLYLALSGLLPFRHPPGLGTGLAWAGLALALATWAATFLLSVPLHRRLGGGHDNATIARLVATNWLRTAAWTAHLALLTWATFRLLP